MSNLLYNSRGQLKLADFGLVEVLYTSNGKDFEMQTSPVTTTLYGVSCQNPKKCAAVGAPDSTPKATMLITDDGGETWAGKGTSRRGGSGGGDAGGAGRGDESVRFD